MNHSAKKQHHENARKKHKHDQQQHARENANRPRSKFPLYMLAVGVAVLLGVVVVIGMR